MRLEGQVALVTGASRGIGRVIATRLAQDGAAVAVNYRSDEASATSLVHALQALGCEAVALAADVRVPGEAEDLVRRTEASLGVPHVLVNNVGEFHLAAVCDTPPETWQAVLDSNLSSAYYVSRAALPGMRRLKRGTIVNIGLSPSSMLRAAPNLAAYSIAKSGIAILTRTLAIEEAPYGIRVNCVSPGLIDNGHLPPQQERWMAARVPMGRLGTPKEVAAAISFLVSDEATYISGADLSVSGAWDWQARPTHHDAMVDGLFEPAGAAPAADRE
jgi:NAD(P)-dependent dehydrogenase (short-subunit alcohol dehydrogenase family)